MAANLVAGQLWAFCRVTGDAVTPVYAVNAGFAGATAITRSAAGTYVLTLTQGVDATECVPNIGLYGAAAGLCTVASTTDTTLTTITWSATVGADADTALADLSYTLTVLRKMG